MLMHVLVYNRCRLALLLGIHFAAWPAPKTLGFGLVFAQHNETAIKMSFTQSIPVDVELYNIINVMQIGASPKQNE